MRERLVRSESDVSQVRIQVSDLQADLGDFQSEVRVEFKAVRSEMAAEFKAVRSEMTAEFKAVRSEMAAGFKEANRDLMSFKDNLTTRMEDLRVGMVMLKAWMFGVAAALLGVMARGFHWI